ncbi:hypothetical protein [Acidovorax sp. NCPPB 4044]|uniref:hypothetical protein n=1 Tax=Acidovorax sp. NCPPB 4044 TaxID=2940490 RepID=UPI00230354D5|nr:hypothetical protein [Acidovorax sp. NCPPB 4044]MDA8522009.1 hypothetical protein [Acidovorax sp. NCPPB 4044]
MKLKHWLDQERGRYASMAQHLGVTAGRMSQIADDGVPNKYMLAVRDFTAGSVSLEEMVADRTPELAAPTKESA